MTRRFEGENISTGRLLMLARLAEVRAATSATSGGDIRTRPHVPKHRATNPVVAYRFRSIEPVNRPGAAQ